MPLRRIFEGNSRWKSAEESRATGHREVTRFRGSLGSRIRLSSLLPAAMAMLLTGSRTGVFGRGSWACEAFLQPSEPLGRRIPPLDRGIFEEKVRGKVPRWRRSGTYFTAPTTAARLASNRRTTKIAMMSLPNVAVGSLFNPQVVSASLRAVAELLSCCVLGLVAAKQGILCPVNVGALSKIVYGIFLPSLLMVNVAKTCVSQPVASLLPIPIFAAVQVGVGIVATAISMRLLKINGNTEAGRTAKKSLTGGYTVFDASTTVALRTKFAMLTAGRHSTLNTERIETHTASNDGSQPA